MKGTGCQDDGRVFKQCGPKIGDFLSSESPPDSMFHAKLHVKLHGNARIIGLCQPPAESLDNCAGFVAMKKPSADLRRPGPSA